MELHEVEQALRKRLDRPIVVRRWGGMIEVLVEVKTQEKLFDIADLELALEEDTVSSLEEQARAVLDTQLPESVLEISHSRERDCFVAGDRFMYRLAYEAEQLILDRSPNQGAWREAQKHAMIATICGERAMIPSTSRRNLSKELEKILPEGEDLTVVALGGLKEYHDKDLGMAQAWFDGFVLKGKWKFENGALCPA